MRKINRIISYYNGLSVQVKASTWFIICSFLQKGISLITTPIFTRLLSQTDYGTYSVFYSWMDILSIIITLNIFYGVYSQGLIKYEDNALAFSSTLQGLTFSLVCFFSLIYFLFYEFVNRITTLSFLQMLIMIGLIWTSAVYGFWAESKRVEYKYQELVIVTILVSVLKPVISIILIRNMNDGGTARVLGLLLAQILYVPLFFVQLVKGKSFFSLRYWLYALKFNIPLLPHYLSQSIMNNADRIMIERMVDRGTAGIYSLAYSVALIMSVFNSAVSQSLNPWIYRKIKSKEYEKIEYLTYPALILIAIPNTMLMLFAPEIIRFFAPKEYYDAIYIIPPVAMSVFFMFMYGFFACFEFYYEKAKYVSIATGIEAILNILLNLIFINIFGYYAAGYTTLVCYALYALLHYYYMNKICKNELGNVKVYDGKRIFFISLVFICNGILIAFSYKFFYIRITIILLGIIVMFIKRRSLMLIIKRILANRKEK